MNQKKFGIILSNEIQKWMDDLIHKNRVKNNKVLFSKIRHLLSLLEEQGAALSMPECRKLSGVNKPSLWELRIKTNNYYRIFWTFWQGKILLLHWFQKDTSRTPASELERARQVYRDWVRKYGP